MKKLIVALLLSLSTLASADSVLEGKFVRIDLGDYAHIVVKDRAGQERSFFVSNHKSFDPVVTQPEKFKNKRVRLHWQTVTREIPEAGGKQTINEATSIQLLK